jgi:hypothetical protein
MSAYPGAPWNEGERALIGLFLGYFYLRNVSLEVYNANLQSRRGNALI